MNLFRTIHASAHATGLPDASVQCIVTSPPYWGLRKYAGEQGVEWPAVDYAPMPGLPLLHIDAMRCELGLEPTPEAYIGHMVLVMREMRRVLRDDGTCWVNLGDSYANTGNAGQDFSASMIGYGGKGRGHIGGQPVKAVPPALKAKDLCMIPARFALAAQADGWWLRSDIIWAKCLSGGVRLYAKTQKGEMPTTVKDLVRLDPSTVKLWTGQKWSQVVSWTETPRPDDSLEIILRSGERIGCTRNHVWPTQRGNIRADELSIGDTIQTCRLPEPENARTPDLLPDEVGRFVGLYIAEGSQSDGTIQVAGHADDDARWQWLSEFVARFDGYAAKHNTGGKSCTININSPVLLGILNAYVSGHTAHDKHLHPRCWARKDTFLQSLLDGYLAGDGHWTGERWRLGFCDNDNLAADLRTLCARIGLSLRLKRTKHTMGGRLFDGWRGEIRLQHRNDGGEIISIGRSRARKFWDIAIADEPHVFALASGVLTHNSNPMPESVTDRPTKAHEMVFLLAKAQRYYWDADAVRENYSDKTEWTYPQPDKAAAAGITTNGTGASTLRVEGAHGRNLRDVWTMATQPTNFAAVTLRGADYVRADGTPYKASPDCPLHGHLAGSQSECTVPDDEQLIAELRRNAGKYDGHVQESSCEQSASSDDSTSNSRPSKQDCQHPQSVLTDTRYSNQSNKTSDDHHDTNACAQTPDRTSRSSNSGEYALDSSDYSLPSDVPIAISHNTQRSRNDHDQNHASSHDNASVQTPDRTDHTLPLLELSGWVEHKSENSISVDDSPSETEINPSGQTFSHNVDRYTLPPPTNDYTCTCRINKTDHFATYPEALAEKCILAGTSARGACPTCGAPWQRVVERGEPERIGGNAGVSVAHAEGPMNRNGNGQWDKGHMPMVRSSTTTGWRPTCACFGEFADSAIPQPCVVLDPFSGSGTTGVVALRLGRAYVGVDISEEYLHGVTAERMGDGVQVGLGI